MKLRVLIVVCVLLGACQNRTGSAVPTGTDTVSFPNVQLFLENQFKEIDSLGVTLMAYKLHDTTPIGVAEARQMIAVFLNTQDASGQYTRAVFPDSVHHRTIISFEADSVPLNRVDVFLDSGTNIIRQLYLQHTRQSGDSSIRQQLIWKTGQEFTLITTVDKDQNTADFHKQRVVWKRP
ncbi:hypothetical protein [Dinghuibacter silviterrae]|uniref:Lipoprotein n=1 Tax=Dinghuibacter silviterrae TaxID=1539049 RepID=A0A4R8DQM9_9BACT|nr:hypothetical protein [Dinghuibacter silviterrae]TDX00098.1 hypothetical protein EDB95_1115 [Dinghuibacter silviterrae]